ncbi:MAG: hypothetical protein ACRDRG_11110 [Pseudonocardiaceae bacterium]
MTLDQAATGPDGQLLEIRELDIAAAAEYADLISIRHDLEFVVNTCTRLLAELAKVESDRESIIIQTLWIAALVTYARCFGTGKRKLGLTTDDVALLPLKGQVTEWHKYLMDMRNKNIAHSVNPFETVTVGALIGLSGEVEGVGFLSLRYVSSDEGGVRQTRDLALALFKLTEGRAQQKESEVLEAAHALDHNHLSRLPIMQGVVPGAEDAGTARR